MLFFQLLNKFKHLWICVGRQSCDFITTFRLEVNSKGKFVNFASCDSLVVVFFYCDVLSSWWPWFFLMTFFLIVQQFSNEYFLPFVDHPEIPFHIANIQSDCPFFWIVIRNNKIKPILVSMGVCVDSEVQIILIFFHSWYEFQISSLDFVVEANRWHFLLIDGSMGLLFWHNERFLYSMPEEGVVLTIKKVFLFWVLKLSEKSMGICFPNSFEHQLLPFTYDVVL